jgi:hypothetical protein
MNMNEGAKYTSTIHYLDTRWWRVVSFTLLPLYFLYSLYRKLGGPQSQSWRYNEEKNLSLLPRIEPQLLGHSAREVVAMPTELSQLPLVIVVEQKSEAYISFIHLTTTVHWLL